MSKNQEDNLQQKYLELQQITQQIKQIQQQLSMIDAQIVEFNSTNISLDDLEKSKAGSEMLVALSPGIFVKGELKDNKELVVNVGSDILVSKNISETKKLIDTQINEINKARDQLLENLQELVLQAQSIEKEFESLSENV